MHKVHVTVQGRETNRSGFYPPYMCALTHLACGKAIGLERPIHSHERSAKGLRQRYEYYSSTGDPIEVEEEEERQDEEEGQKDRQEQNSEPHDDDSDAEQTVSQIRGDHLQESSIVHDADNTVDDHPKEKDDCPPPPSIADEWYKIGPRKREREVTP